MQAPSSTSQAHGLTRASLRYYRATNAMVILGVAVAVAVLAGALLVGASVRESLRRIALGRLGATDVVVAAPTPFSTRLADRVGSAVPMIAVDGAVSHDESRRAAGRVAVYGIDERFARFHGVTGFDVSGREALISPALARELGAQAGDGVTLRVARPTDIPLSSLQGRRDATGERLRLTIKTVLGNEPLSEFSLAPSQGPVLAIYVAMPRLQQDLEIGDRANVILARHADAVFDSERFLREQIGRQASLDDLGLRVRSGPGSESIVESRAGFIPDEVAQRIVEAAQESGRSAEAVLTYVANTIRIGDREIPYSTVTAMNHPSLTAARVPRVLLLNQWAADALKARVGDTVTLDYYLWSDEDGLRTATADFTMAGVAPMDGPGGDQTLTPEYPGITDSADMTSWDPPFPVDLKRVQPTDEDYWDRYRTAPKAIILLADGQRLWGSRYGKVSSVRLSGSEPFETRAVDPIIAGFTARHVRNDAVAAAQGTTDFGEYFLYFSFFLVVSALLLAYLFFAVGLEQRTTEVGLLSSVGFSPAAIRRAFVREGAILTAIGAAIGAVAAVGYGAAIMFGLRTWWVGAVGTTALELHVAPEWIAAGVIGAAISGLAALWAGVRAMSRRSARSLLKGDADVRTPASAAATKIAAVALIVLGVGLVGAAGSGAINATAGFFGAGGAWLVGGLCAASALLRRHRASAALGHGQAAVMRLGLRHTSARPARSVLSLALIAFACFVLVSVGAFRKDVSVTPGDRASGVGGYSLIAESVAPLMHDPNTSQGRSDLLFESTDPLLARTAITRFRLRPGDETSCLTLYRPTNPRIIAPEPRFFDEPRFSFASSLASSPEEMANPWQLLNRTFDDGAIPAIADQTTLMYVLHLAVGDDFVFKPDGHTDVRLRIVGALADSVLQSELMIGEAAFVRLFPRHEGYRIWMIAAAPGDMAALTTQLEDRLSDFGLDVTSTQERWASYHQVENTYLATFQALGSLGLLLGTIGLGAVLARNVLERRRELGLLSAIGYGPSNLRAMVMSEGLALVVGGLLLGATCALVAILPALRDRAQSLPLGSLSLLLVAVVVTGAAASLLAVRIVTRMRVLDAIKSE
ncbi:MAG TPA: FtsX-like permease family protein [Vicinamibacterales bacterium]|nr:FtsX-like permease family protein [Vicinamibacterales bacterium]